MILPSGGMPNSFYVTLSTVLSPKASDALRLNRMRWPVAFAPDLGIDSRGGTQPQQDGSHGVRCSLYYSLAGIIAEWML